MNLKTYNQDQFYLNYSLEYQKLFKQSGFNYIETFKNIYTKNRCWVYIRTQKFNNFLEKLRTKREEFEGDLYIIYIRNGCDIIECFRSSNFKEVLLQVLFISETNSEWDKFFSVECWKNKKRKWEYRNVNLKEFNNIDKLMKEIRNSIIVDG